MKTTKLSKMKDEERRISKILYENIFSGVSFKRFIKMRLYY